MSDQAINSFLAGAPFAVVGASRDRLKYGNRVLRAYLQNRLPVFPVNPNVESIENLPCFPCLSALPESVHGVSIITRPEITEQIVAEAIALGIQHLWLQPGAESPKALAKARDAGCQVIAEGPCILVKLGFQDGA